MIDPRDDPMRGGDWSDARAVSETEAVSQAVSSTPRVPASLDREYSMLIGGRWVGSASGETFAAVDPFTGSEWGRVPRGTTEDVGAAVAAARRAFDEGPWPRMAPVERAEALRRIAQLIREANDELVLAQVLENGKLIGELGAGTTWLARQCDYTAGLAENLRGETIDTGIPNMFTYTRREPLGVVAAITPWNSPLGLLAFKLFPALAAGCTVVAKPSEFTPISTLLLARIIDEAGLPEGVVNVVTGFGDLGAALVEDPRVDKIMFTGSTPTGRRIGQLAGGRLARVGLELGGKSPNIVFADADLERAVDGALGGILSANGQTCVAGSRILVERSVYGEVVDRISAKAAAQRIGDPLDPATQIGPMANRPQFDKVLQYVGEGLSTGARLAAGGHAVDRPDLADGIFIEPTIFADVDNRTRIAQEEIFGPVACVIPFDSEDDAIRIANDTDFGLAAGVWTQSMGRAQKFVRELRAGTVWVNTYRIGHHYLPFGGVKQSGVGRELGTNAVEEFTELKAVWMDTTVPDSVR